MEHGRKHNMKFPHFSVNGKEMPLIMHINQYQLPFFHKSFQSSTAIKTVFRIIRVRNSAISAANRTVSVSLWTAEGEEVNI
jgi:hypothetical protein